MALSIREKSLLNEVSDGKAKENHRDVFRLINKGLVRPKYPYSLTAEGEKRLGGDK